MAVRIIVDSASDITPKEAQEMDIVHVPLKVAFGEHEYLDAVTLNVTEFYEKLIESDTLPVTSQVNPATFADVISSVLKEGDTAVILAVSSKLSGTYQSACIAAEEFEGRVFVVDTLNVTVGQRLLAMRAVQMRAAGYTAQQIAEQLDSEKGKVRLLAVLDTLEYLKKGGRISATVAFAGNLLNIKPVVTVRDGLVEMCGKARGSKNGSNLLRKMTLEGKGVDFNMPHCVAYSGLSDHLLKKYIEDSADIWKTETEELITARVGSVIGTHVGPGAIAVAFFEKD